MSQILAGKTLIEVVVASGHGCVYGIKAAAAHEFESLAEVQAALYVVSQTLKVGKCGVAFIAVIDIHLNAQLLQRQDTTDTEQIFLLHTVLPVAAIESVGDTLVKLGVHLIVSIEEIECHASYVHLPYEGMHGESSEGHINYYLLALAVEHALDGHTVEVLRLILCNLLSVHREGLSKVAITIEETDGSHINVGVRSLLHIVARQNTKTTGIDLDVVVHTILHAEVCHTGTIRTLRLVHVLAEHLIDTIHACHEFLVSAHHLQTLVADAVEEFHRVLLHLGPDFRIKALEEFECLLIPAEPKVVGHFVEGFQQCRDVAFHRHRTPLGLIGICDVDHFYKR